MGYGALTTALVVFLSWSLYRAGRDIALLRARVGRGSNPDPGAILTPFRSVDLDGHPVSVGFGADRPYTLLCFFTSDCEFCHRAAPVWNRWALDFELPVVGVAVDGLAAVGRRDDLRLSFPVVEFPNTATRAAYQVSSVPLTLLVDERGEVLLSHTGEPNQDILARVRSLMLGRKSRNFGKTDEDAGAMDFELRTDPP